MRAPRSIGGEWPGKAPAASHAHLPSGVTRSAAILATSAGGCWCAEARGARREKALQKLAQISSLLEREAAGGRRVEAGEEDSLNAGSSLSDGWHGAERERERI